MKQSKPRLSGLTLAGVIFAAGSASAAEVKLHCDLSRVGVKHPYLPTELTLTVDGRYEAFFLDEVVIKNVSTMPVPGEVTYQGRKKVRISWPSEAYEYTKNTLPKHNGAYRLPPNSFDFNLSLNKGDWAIKVDLKDNLYGMSHGSGKGRCVPVT